MWWYLDGFPSEHGPSGSTLESPGLVELDQTFVVLQSHSGCDARTAGASVHLWDQGGSHLSFTRMMSIERLRLSAYLGFSEHADVGSGLR